MNEKAIKRELRRVRSREADILTKRKYGRVINLESLLNKYIPDTLEETLDAAFREAFKMIFAKGTPLIGKTFNEKKLRQSKGTDAEAQMLWAKDMLLTGVEGTGLGLVGVGLPDIPVFTGMLLRTVYQTALSYQFEYKTKTEQYFILHLIEAALARGKKAETLSKDLDELMLRIDEEGFTYYGSINDQIAKTSKAMSDEMLYLKFVQTIPVVGVAGGLSNPIYLNIVKSFADVKYRKRRLLIRLRKLRAEQKALEEPKEEAPACPDAPVAPAEASVELDTVDAPQVELDTTTSEAVDAPQVELDTTASEAVDAPAAPNAAPNRPRIRIYDPDGDEE
ncbi:MAG: EcsC family protein [Firmicutes bacterium]|nr:EcsC family protein [Bacillota bacterium]